MRGVLSAVAAVWVSAAWAQTGALGTRSNLVSTPSSSGGQGGLPILQMVITLIVIAALIKWVLPKFITKLNRRLTPTLGSSIRIEESAQLAGGMLYVVQVRQKTLLLSVTPAGVSCLSDLSEPNSVKADEPPFFDILDAEQSKDVEALVRLEQLAGPI